MNGRATCWRCDGEVLVHSLDVPGVLVRCPACEPPAGPVTLIDVLIAEADADADPTHEQEQP